MQQNGAHASPAAVARAAPAAGQEGQPQPEQPPPQVPLHLPPVVQQQQQEQQQPDIEYWFSEEDGDDADWEGEEWEAGAMAAERVRLGASGQLHYMPRRCFCTLLGWRVRTSQRPASHVCVWLVGADLPDEVDLHGELDSDTDDVSEDIGDEWSESELEELDEWEEFVHQQADALSASSEEPEVEQQGAQALARATAGRSFHAHPAAYHVPSENHHFQSADARCVASSAASPGGALLAAVFDRDGVAAYRLPPAGEVGCLGLSQPPAVRLGGFQAARDIYSLAFSPDARFLAAGGDAGVVTIYTLDPRAPPRPPLHPCSPLNFSGLIYFYTPLQPPGPAPPPAQQQGQGQQPPGGGGGAGGRGEQQPLGVSEAAGPSGHGSNEQGPASLLQSHQLRDAEEALLVRVEGVASRRAPAALHGRQAGRRAWRAGMAGWVCGSWGPAWRGD